MSSTELDATVADALDRAAYLKQDLVTTYGVGEALPLMIELRLDGIRLGTLFPGGQRRSARSLVMMAIALSDADNALFLGEAFSYHADQPPSRVPFGQLAKWFAEGEPHTQECVQVLSAHRDGRLNVGQRIFHYEGRRVVWDDLYVYGREVTGELTEMMHRGFVLQRRRPFAALPVSAISEVLECEVSVPRITVPTRNATCPCGSGRKAKRCCWP